ncbi:MAG: CRISPR-associated protein Cas4 [Aquificae bacterium]|nr:CRISPR-associated protein Cas4 [Aquificota bacterium]
MGREVDLTELRINGVKVSYFVICKRKLWLFSRNITMEHTSDRVLLGKLLHEESFSREKAREVLLKELVKIDVVGDEELLEIKLSDKLEKAHEVQLLYYLYFLKKELGIEMKGVITYPRKFKRKEVYLTEEREREIENILREVERILSSSQIPPLEKKPYCSRCAYAEFCFA